MLSLRKGMVLLLLGKHPFVSMKRWKGRRNVELDPLWGTKTIRISTRQFFFLRVTRYQGDGKS